MSSSRRRSDGDSVTFSSTVAAGASGEDTFKLSSGGVINHLQVRIYTGAELDLHLEPVIRTRDEVERPIVKFAGKSVIDGDDDFYQFKPFKKVNDNDLIVIKYNHTDAAGSPLDYRVNVDVDYRTALDEAADALL